MLDLQFFRIEGHEDLALDTAVELVQSSRRRSLPCCKAFGESAVDGARISQAFFRLPRSRQSRTALAAARSSGPTLRTLLITRLSQCRTIFIKAGVIRNRAGAVWLSWHDESNDRCR